MGLTGGKGDLMTRDLQSVPVLVIMVHFCTVAPFILDLREESRIVKYGVAKMTGLDRAALGRIYFCQILKEPHFDSFDCFFFCYILCPFKYKPCR